MCPLFDVVCPKCGAKKEVFRRFINSDVLETCECGTIMEKTISPANFALKGAGWARDSYGDSNGRG